jgi:hypothetical protein
MSFEKSRRECRLKTYRVVLLMVAFRSKGSKKISPEITKIPASIFLGQGCVGYLKKMS